MRVSEEKGYKVISKRIARQYYEMGTTLYLVPCKTRFKNDWITPFALKKSDVLEFDTRTFDDRVNSYIIYNCNNQLGRYPTFFIREEKKDEN